MNAPLQFAILLSVSAAATGVTWLVKGEPEEQVVVRCDPSTLKDDEICLADVSGKVLWVDSRTRREWLESGLEGSILWNLDPKENQRDFEAGAAMKVMEAELVVVYCGSRACGTSRQIADRIRALQLGPPVKVLHGGWEALKDSSPSS
jgi:rhodanese-related sulfurtransferase